MSGIICVPKLPLTMFVARITNPCWSPMSPEEFTAPEPHLEFRFKGRIDESVNCPPDGRVYGRIYIYELGDRK